MSKYSPVHKVNTIKLDVRGLQYAVHTWGDPVNKPVLLLHGLNDTGLSFQFLADALAEEWYLLAPDWRGFGDSGRNQQGYWFPDYLADLDVLVDQFSPDKTMRLVGHSMGGNIASLYSGIRADRVSHLVSIDVYGLPDSNPADAQNRYGIWLGQLKQGTSFPDYEDLQQLIRRIDKLAPGLDSAHAQFIAEAWSIPLKEGAGFRLKVDPVHKRVNPVLYRREEARSCWRKIAANTLFIFGEDSHFYKRYREEGFQQEYRECLSKLEEDAIAAAGHMIHWQQPEKLAAMLQAFLSR